MLTKFIIKSCTVFSYDSYSIFFKFHILIFFKILPQELELHADILNYFSVVLKIYSFVN